MLIHMQTNSLLMHSDTPLSPDRPLQGSHCCVLDDGLSVVLTRYRARQALVEESHTPHTGAGVIITFGLQGHSDYRERWGPRVDFRHGHTTVTAFDHSQGERHIPEGETVLQLRLVASTGWLARYLGERYQSALPASKGVRSLAFQPTSAGSRAHLQALQASLQTDSARIQKHIHALSLLGEQLEALLPEPRHTQHIATADVERIVQAHEILINELDRPLTLAYLGARVGLGEQKLKQGFRRMFGTTPQHFLHQQRMRHAHMLLESGQQVAQAAYATGYRHPSNFSSAFTRFFGYAPKAIKQRKS
ncbi:AraC family transcriptional regulator [Halomonas sp. SpR8]|uniref:helix-turn-helix transcriptional regulator n=1 Tax=Halomonas sp. SpR8 TaxID=3050463 RepID=UPI0027E48BE4|nr:AraC family transcriptional regulator [Halomonas sp. SpR8]MDQ7727789.1 AraC family transcriptional regulator [Halomonas sp. SpR8]